MFVPDLPKTRSGKIMRRLLRDIAEGRALGDTTTLADAGVVETDPRRAAARRRTEVPFDFLEAQEDDGGGHRQAGGAPARRAGPGIPFDGADRGVAARRADGGPRAALRCAQQARAVDHRRRPLGADRRLERLARRLASRRVDPYDLIIVLAGETLAAAADRRRAVAHKVHKVAYDVALEVPPFRVIGTVYLFPGPSRSACSTARPRCSCRSSTRPRRRRPDAIGEDSTRSS